MGPPPEELPTTQQIGIGEYANEVVHPVTKETTTKYKTLIEDLLLKDKWKKAMCVELGRWHMGIKTSQAPTQSKL